MSKMSFLKFSTIKFKTFSALLMQFRNSKRMHYRIFFMPTQEALDSFHDTEFWYLDRARAMTEKDSRLLQRQEEKWWLPAPRVPVDGLSEEARKHLLHQKKSVSEVLKAVLAINAQVLSEVEVPTVYWDALPKVAFGLVLFLMYGFLMSSL